MAPPVRFHAALFCGVLSCLATSLALADAGPYPELESVLLCQSERDPRAVVSLLEKSGAVAAQGDDTWTFTQTARAEGFWRYAVEIRLRDGCVAVAFHGDTGELGPIMKFWTERHSQERIERIRNGSFSVKNAAGWESKYQFNPLREVVLSCRKPKAARN